MRFLTIGTVLSLFLGSYVVFAGELDNEPVNVAMKAHAKDLPGTVVVRTDAEGNVSVYHSKEVLDKSDEAREMILKAGFINIKKNEIMEGKVVASNELDNDSSTGSWYFYYGYYPCYNYYGFNYGYTPYYSWNYGYYNYNYYGWGGWGGWGGYRRW